MKWIKVLNIVKHQIIGETVPASTTTLNGVEKPRAEYIHLNLNKYAADVITNVLLPARSDQSAWDSIIYERISLMKYTREDRINYFRSQDWSRDVWNNMYLIFYSSIFIPRIQIDIIDALKKLNVNTLSTLHIYDIGIGTGTTILAAITLFKNLYDIYIDSPQTFPITKIIFHLYDTNIGAIKYNENMANKFQDHKNDSFIDFTFKFFNQSASALSDKSFENNSIVCTFNTLEDFGEDVSNGIFQLFDRIRLDNCVFIIGEYYSRNRNLLSHINHQTRNELVTSHSYGRVPDKRIFSWLKFEGIWNRVIIGPFRPSL